MVKSTTVFCCETRYLVLQRSPILSVEGVKAARPSPLQPWVDSTHIFGELEMDRHYAPADIARRSECTHDAGSYARSVHNAQRSESAKARQSLADERIIKLQAMDQHKNQFLATLAHELRSPLAPIQCALDSMGLMKLEDEVESLRLMMSRQVGQMAFLINDLLDISRISCGKLVLHQEVVELSSIIASAVEASSTFINEAAQTLIITGESERAFVFADASRLTQVVSNLLNNASKYSGPNCRIELNVFAANGSITIQIRDNGTGIAREQLPRIFDLFSQVSGRCERGPAGLGIGLSLVKTIVELHGGTVTAESGGNGRGSLFSVQLPKAEQPREVLPIETRLVASTADRSFRVLVIEDQRAIRMMMVSLLEKLGHVVEVAEDAVQAVDKLGDFKPEIIFSDISMPGMNGLELAQLLRRRSDMSDVFMVAVTGSGTVNDRELAIEYGFDELMTKPVEMQRIQGLFRALSAKTAC
jgi:signal transduction histidine kinase/ActR/RegA family two-component response regulator